MWLDRRKDHNFISVLRRTAAFALAFLIFTGIFDGLCFPVETQAAEEEKTLTLAACRLLAIENSLEYENAEDKVASKQAAYESAVKAIRLKEASLRQFRWSPLLSFKFPTSPTFAEASEFQNKPTQLKYEIKVAQHALQDKTYEIIEKVNNLYVDIVVLQETIEFNTARAEKYQDGLDRNTARVRTGDANQADVDKIQSKLTATNNKIASDERTLSADLQKLSKMLDMDVTTGYKFEKPFVEADINRDMLQELTVYTEDRDQTYYEACVNVTTAKAELDVNTSLIKNKYGGEFNTVGRYVSSAENGDDINKKSFKNDYKAFLTQIDSHWQGSKRILFIKIPRLWFKGDMDGTRYIEDDPYVLYQNVLDYTGAVNEKTAAKDNLDQSVTDAYNNYVSVRNAYEQSVKDVEKAEKELDAALVLNRRGEMTFEEYDSQMQSYEELQNSLIDNMKLYTTSLYSFDRLTCGGVSALLSGTDADLHTAVVGESYIVPETVDGAYYTLEPIIQNQEFELNVVIPEDFEVSITDYELWVDGQQLGDRTSVDKKLRHMALTTETVTEAVIRLYDGDEFVDDCKIVPSDEYGELTVTTGYDIQKDQSEIFGTYTIENTDTDLILIKIVPEDKNVKSFKVYDENGEALGGKDPVSIETGLKHLPIVQGSMDDLTVELYDESGNVLYKGRFDSLNGKIRKLVE
ncbi:MAG: hypothetical protein K6G12_02470 [Lachnospiraceae bacterium]|nr:hypothetical protein [Lachnospiraceae bacterium]